MPIKSSPFFVFLGEKRGRQLFDAGRFGRTFNYSPEHVLGGIVVSRERVIICVPVME